MVRVDPLRDVARLLAPPTPFQGMRFSQGVVVDWNPDNFRNTIDWRGIALRDVPVLSGVDALGFQPGDVVGLLGWSPNGGMGSWWIIGRLNTPGVDSPDLVVRGSNIILEGGELMSIDAEVDSWIKLSNGNIFFGSVSGGLNDDIASIRSVNQDLLIDADANLFITGDNQVFINSPNGDAVVRGGDGFLLLQAQGGATSDIDISTQDSPVGDDIWVRAQGGLNLGAGGLVPVAGDGSAELQATNQARMGIGSGSNPQVVCGSGNSSVLLSMGTTGSAANLNTAGVGAGLNGIRVVTSSRRYKQDIRDFHIDPKLVLQVPARTWRDKTEVAEDPDSEQWHVGAIAEELDELGLSAFVNYNNDGEPEAITYDRFSMALLEVCKWQQQQIEQLTQRITALEAGQQRVTPVEPALKWPETTALPKRRPGLSMLVLVEGKDKQPPGVSTSNLLSDNES